MDRLVTVEKIGDSVYFNSVGTTRNGEIAIAVDKRNGHFTMQSIGPDSFEFDQNDPDRTRLKVIDVIGDM